VSAGEAESQTTTTTTALLSIFVYRATSTV